MRWSTTTAKKFLEELLIGEIDEFDHLLVLQLAKLFGQRDKAIYISLMHFRILGWLQNEADNFSH